MLAAQLLPCARFSSVAPPGVFRPMVPATGEHRAKSALSPTSGVDAGGAEQEHHHRGAHDTDIGGLRR